MSRFFKTISTFLLLVLGTTLYAQPKKEEIRENLKDASFGQKFEVGLNLVYDKVYIDALYVWEILLEEDQNNANLLYKIGMCYINLNRESEALPYFEKAQYAISKKYNPVSHLERNAPPDVLYYLAKSNHINGNVDSAASQYTFFIENVHKKHEKFALGQLGQQQCLTAKRLMASPEPYVVENVGSEVNQATPEYSPIITIDGSTLFFTSKRLRGDSSNFEMYNRENGQYFEDVYVSYKDGDGNWTAPQHLGFCRPKRNDASISSSPDGSTIFVYRDVNGGDIFYSQVKDTTFEELRPFPSEELNSKYWESHATISNDQNYLYFVSDRPGGFGGQDIWRLKKLPNGEWSKAYNLGPTINTEYDEDSPFLGVDSKTMYFSSNGPKSMGGFDIFVTQIDEDEVWSEPVNLGYPLNTVDDDIFYTTTADGQTGYYSSEKKDGFGDKDIYTVFNENDYIQNIAILTGFIVPDNGTRIPAGIKIEVTDLSEAGEPKIYAPRRRDGGYVLTLLPCHTYQIDYVLNDTLTFHENELYVPCNSSYQEIKHELLLDMVDFSAAPVDDKPDNDNDTDQKDAGNDTDQKDTGNDTDQKDTGNDTDQKDTGNDTDQKDTGNDTDQKDTGNDTDQKDTGNDTNQKDTGNDTDQKDTGNNTDQKDTGNNTDQKDTGNNTDQKDTGNDTDQKDTGNDTDQKDTGNDTDQKDTGNDTDQKDTGNDTDQKDTGNDTDQKDTGNDTDQKDTSNDTNQKDTGNTAVQKDTSNDTDKKNIKTDFKTIPSYQENLGYNQDEIKNNAEFKAFVKGIKTAVDNGISVTVVITASASQVPTQTYKNNKDLAMNRLNNGNEALLSLLKEYGVDISKVKIVLKEASVNGPAYNNDAQKNKHVYQKYQYIRFDLQF